MRENLAVRGPYAAVNAAACHAGYTVECIWCVVDNRRRYGAKGRVRKVADEATTKDIADRMNAKFLKRVGQ